MTRDYYGTKRITAWAQEKGGKPGYAVKYPDGYISWSPKEVFESAYQPITSMSFGHAVEALKCGKKVARAGWNGKGMWLELVLSIHDIPPLGAKIPIYRLTIDTEDAPGPTALPWLGMKTADNKFVPWLASQTDVLANDWLILGER